MFGFLKEKLKKAVSAFSKHAEEEAKTVVVEEVIEQPKRQEKVTKQVSHVQKKEEKKDHLKLKKTENTPELPTPIKEETKPILEPEQKSFFGRLKDKIVGKKEESIPEEKETKKEINKQKIEERKEIPHKKIENKVPTLASSKAVHTQPGLPSISSKDLHPHSKKTQMPEKDIPKHEKAVVFTEKKTEQIPEYKPATQTVTPHVSKEKSVPSPAASVKQIEIQSPVPSSEKEEPESKSFFGMLKEKITKQVISADKFEELFFDLEVVLLENNVAVEVIEKIKEDLKKGIVDVPITRGKVFEKISQALRESIQDVLSIEGVDVLVQIKEKKEKPYVIAFVGVNGSGKTTTIAKFTHMLKENSLKCVIAASDTFRAAAMEQLQKHADALNVKLIKHEYGSDPAAVAFDAIAHAKAKGIDVVLIDTAGRLHSNENLMDELRKVVRVAKPDMTLFIGESITGNDCIEQAKHFNEAAHISGIILSKADVDEKGGAALSVSYVTQKPILYLGTGQTYQDLEPFDPQKIMGSIGL